MSDTHDTMHAYGLVLEEAIANVTKARDGLLKPMEYVELLEFESNGRFPKRLQRQHAVFRAAYDNWLRKDEAFKVAGQLLVGRKAV